ncbi:DUF4177 domain-containing protein [Clostridium autoethanogenum]|jgi:hypothetical protein|uniref:DUF4177 domain-containing protein n=1 Tax=Clostridium autoethanogenum TaxID=84023 RepID=A0A3M0SR60_9CLOT|nr:DUF4177 domain-containing protein [Clostridium autoethanogenum]RMD00275.1 DUF4177 domain-containing protein [Clostridium autoethanogenum]
MVWKYKTFTVDHFMSLDKNLTLEEKLNKYGAEGWELVGILQKPFAGLGNPPKYLNVDTIVFKKTAEE